MNKTLLSPRFERSLSGQAVMPLSPKQLQMLAAVKGKLESAEFALVHQDCPCLAAANDHDVAIAEIDRYGLPVNSVLCLACGTVRINPYLDEPSLSDFYASFYQDLYARNRNLPHLFSYQRSHYGERIGEYYGNCLSKESSVLEVGCGTGGALLAFADRGCFVAGCDFSSELVTYGTSQGAKNLWTGTIDDAPQDAARKYDLIYLFHVLEHVSEPAALLSQLRSKLTHDGRILAVVPDLFRIDCHRNPAGDALKFLHIAHKYNYSTIGLAAIAHQAHLSARQILPPPREYGPHEDARDLSEMWMEFAPASVIIIKLAPSAGDENLRYLLATEQMFLAGSHRRSASVATLSMVRPPSAHPYSPSILKPQKPAGSVIWVSQVIRKILCRIDQP